MVCKKDVFLWFRNLKGSTRIEVMNGFLNMCYPLELRFYGTCLEDMGKKDFYATRDQEIKANNSAEILKIRNIHDPFMRSKLIVVLSLLNSSNTLCANELFKILSEEMKIEILASSGILADPKLVEHYLLLLALAQHHPAFSFTQQRYFLKMSISLEKCARDMNPKTKYESEVSCLQSPIFPSVGSLPPTGISERDVYNNSPQSYQYPPPPLQQKNSDCQYNSVRITNLKVKAPHRRLSIRIRVAWGNNKNTDAFKTPKELLCFHQKILELFPADAKMANQEKFIPPFPQSVLTAVQMNNLNETVISAVSEYIQHLNSRLPGYLLENDFVTSFFMPSTHTRASLAKGNRCPDSVQSDNPPRSTRYRSLIVYNSQMADNSSGHCAESRQKTTHSSVPRKLSENGSCGRSSPLMSPMQSPSSSPYVSPISSETNSRAASPWNHINGPYLERGACNTPLTDPSAMDKVLIKDQMPDQRNYEIEELQAMPIEELESLGILQDYTKGKKVLDRKSPPNGLINPYLSKSSTNPVKPGLLMQQPMSNDSSPVCSEYSSPPQSPSPAEACNQSNSLSSSTEENVDKRISTKAVPEFCKVDEISSQQIVHESNFKRTDDDALSLKGIMNRTTISVLPFPAPYSTIISQMPPPQNMKPTYLPIPCRTSNAPQHMSPGPIVFDNQFSRLPLPPSALTYLTGHPRSHTVTPDRVLTTSNIPISTVSPFPVVTSGCATVPSATCCITTHKSSNVTVVTNSCASTNRHVQKNPSMRDTDMVKPVQHPGEAPYAGFMLSSTTQLTPASCSCFTTNSARPSPAPSPSMSPGATPQPTAVPVSLPYIGMPYVFHHSLQFLQPQAPANGFVPQPGMANPGQTFSYALPNGLAIPPELMYPGQTFALQSPSAQGNPGQVASPVSQCYGAFPQTAALPVKLLSCYNCGKVGHRGTDCKDQTMDDVNKAGKFQLNFAPIPKIPDGHE